MCQQQLLKLNLFRSDSMSLLIICWNASQVALVIEEPACQCRRHKRLSFDPWVGKIPRRRARQPIPVLPGESHGRGAWWATDHRVAKSQTRLKWLSRHTHDMLQGWMHMVHECCKTKVNFNHNLIWKLLSHIYNELRNWFPSIRLLLNHKFVPKSLNSL